MPTVTDRARAYAAGAAEQIHLLAPGEFSAFEAVVVHEKGASRMERHDVKLGPGPEAPPGLFFDPLLRVDWLVDCLTRLQLELGFDLGGFSTWNAIFDAKATTLSQSGAAIPVDTGALVTGPALHTFLHAHGAKLVAGQQALQQLTSSWGYWGGWDRAARRVSFKDDAGKARTVGAEIIGSFSPGEASWCWAWANGSFDPALTAAVAAARDQAPAGLTLMKRGGFPCDDSFAYTAALTGAHFLGGRPVYRFKIERTGVLLFYALDVA